MSDRQLRILTALRAHLTVDPIHLAYIIDAPRASVRRDVQELRKAGYNISYGYNGVYRYYGV